MTDAEAKNYYDRIDACSDRNDYVGVSKCLDELITVKDEASDLVAYAIEAQESVQWWS